MMTRMCVVLSHLGHLCQLVSVAAPQSLLECHTAFSPAPFLAALLDLLLSPLGTAVCGSVVGDCQCHPLVSEASVSRVILEQTASPPVGVTPVGVPQMAVWSHPLQCGLCTCKVSSECGVYPTPVCMWCGPMGSGCTNNIYIQ